MNKFILDGEEKAPEESNKNPRKKINMDELKITDPDRYELMGKLITISNSLSNMCEIMNDVVNLHSKFDVTDEEVRQAGLDSLKKLTEISFALRDATDALTSINPIEVYIKKDNKTNHG